MWQGGLIGRLVKKYGEPKLVLAGFLFAAIAYVLLGVVPSDDLLMIGLVAVVSSFGNGVLRPVITSRITQAVGRHEQGVAIGISGSLSSVAMALAPPDRRPDARAPLAGRVGDDPRRGRDDRPVHGRALRSDAAGGRRVGR